MKDVVRFTNESVDVRVDEEYLYLDIKDIFTIKISKEVMGRLVKTIFEKPNKHIH